MMQPRPSQSQYCQASLAASFAGAGWARSKAIWPVPTRPALVLAAAHSRRKKQQSGGTSLHKATTTAGDTSSSRLEARSLAAQEHRVYVGGKLLLQSFLDSPSNQLRLSFQLVSATVAGTHLHTQVSLASISLGTCINLQGNDEADACAFVQEATGAG